MFMRRRPLMRAAVVGGGAYAAGRSMGRRAEQRDPGEDEQNERISDLEQRQAAPPAPYQQPPAEAAPSPVLARLNHPATPHKRGLLPYDALPAPKAKRLGT